MLTAGQIAHLLGGRFDPLDRVVATIASTQHGVVARWQLLAAGVSARRIERRVSTGGLVPIHPGVYAAGHSAVSRHGEWLAAVLAGGQRAMLSHRSAAAAWGLIEDRPQLRIEITVPHVDGGGRRLAGLAIHRSRLPASDDRVERHAIPMTSVARTLIDLAGAPSKHLLLDAFKAADRFELLDRRELAFACERACGRRGTQRLRRIADAHRELPATRSAMERRFLAVCDRFDIPRPAVNVEVEDFEVDCVWMRQRLVVELDSWGFHKDRATFESDRRRDTKLQLAGYRVIRITWRRLRDSPEGVAIEIHALLADPVPAAPPRS